MSNKSGLVLPGSSLKTETKGEEKEESAREAMGSPLRASRSEDIHLEEIYKLVSDKLNLKPDRLSLYEYITQIPEPQYGSLDFMADEVERTVSQTIAIMEEASVNQKATSSCVEAMMELLELIDHKDWATAFYNCDFLEAIFPLLSHQSHTVPWLAAEVIANCCKISYCQNLTCSDDNVFTTLMEMAHNKEIDMKKYKALSALTEMIRRNEIGINKFLRLNGAAMVCEVLGCGDEFIVKKIYLLILELSASSSKFKLQLIGAGIVKTLMELVRESGSNVENYLLILDHIVTDCEAAANELLKPELAFFEYYSEVIVKSCKNKQYQKEQGMVKQILKKLPEAR